MTNHLKVTGDAFALCNVDEHVIGVVCKTNETQWSFIPLVKGNFTNFEYVPLKDALLEALKFKANQ